MSLNFIKWVEVLENTPAVVSALLHNISDEWTNRNEGENTWTAKEVIAHLIVCEQTNWLPRARIILSDNELKTFVPMDMTGHFKVAEDNTLQQLLFQFKDLRERSLEELKKYKLQEHDLLKIATHPVAGEVSLQQVIATWVSHDMAHISQIARIIAKQNTDYVGNFKRYLKILG